MGGDWDIMDLSNERRQKLGVLGHAGVLPARPQRAGVGGQCP